MEIMLKIFIIFEPENVIFDEFFSFRRQENAFFAES